MTASRDAGRGDRNRPAEEDGGRTAVDSEMVSTGQPLQSVAPIDTILRQHPNERLYVKPLEWTARHLELLGCRYLPGHGRPRPWRPFFYYQLPPCSSADPLQDDLEDGISGKGHRGRHKLNSLEHRRRLSKRKKFGTRYAMRAIGLLPLSWRIHNTTKLLDWGPLRIICPNASLDFDFKGKRAALIQPVSIFGSRRPFSFMMKPPYGWESPHDHVQIPNYPLVIWLDYDAFVAKPRQARFTAHDNEPVQALREIRYRHVNPPSWEHDPYLAAALIALAQKQRRWEMDWGPRLGRRPVDPSHVFTTRMVVARFTPRRLWYVYTADIPLNFLNKLDRPSVATDAPTAVDIIHDQVESRPYHSFRDRLLERLGLAKNEMKQQGVKRKRREMEEDSASDSCWDSGECDSPEATEDEDEEDGDPKRGGLKKENSSEDQMGDEVGHGY